MPGKMPPLPQKNIPDDSQMLTILSFRYPVITDTQLAMILICVELSCSGVRVFM